MKTRLIVLALLVALASLGFAVGHESKSLYRNLQFGFTIEPPQVPRAGPAKSQVVAIFHLPPESGVAPNLNIQAQRWKKGLDAYVELSESQFEEAGITLASTKRLSVGGKNAVEWEFDGRQQGEHLSFLARAVERTPDEILLLTYTCRKASWTRCKDVFHKSLDSLQLLDQPERTQADPED